jgi:hypothetical protein
MEWIIVRERLLQTAVSELVVSSEYTNIRSALFQHSFTHRTQHIFGNELAQQGGRQYAGA